MVDHLIPHPVGVLMFQQGGGMLLVVLALERGGKKTQKQQKEVVARLDEIIKELENQGGS